MIWLKGKIKGKKSTMSRLKSAVILKTRRKQYFWCQKSPKKGVLYSASRRFRDFFWERKSCFWPVATRKEKWQFLKFEHNSCTIPGQSWNPEKLFKNKWEIWLIIPELSMRNHPEWKRLDIYLGCILHDWPFDQDFRHSRFFLLG